MKTYRYKNLKNEDSITKALQEKKYSLWKKEQLMALIAFAIVIVMIIFKEELFELMGITLNYLFSLLP